MDFDEFLSVAKDIISKETKKIMKRLDRIEENQQSKSVAEKKRALDKKWDVLTEKFCIWFEHQTFQQKKKKHAQHVEVVEEREILAGEELVTTLIEESIPIKLEVPNYFGDNKNIEEEIISFQTKKVKIFSPISEFNNVQDLRTNLLQERENDVIPCAKE